MPSAQNPKPIKLGIRMYQVGFGDCFVLTFRYAAPLADGRDVRHILIDFGSTRPVGQTKDLVPVATAIAEQTKGEIDVVVVTHRHKDHLSGFGPKEAPLLSMKPGFPKLVVRSWTEHPRLDRAAKGPAAVAARNAAGPMDALVGRKSSEFVNSLRAAERFAVDLQAKVQGAVPNSLPAELKQLVDDQISNKEAVDQLAASQGGRVST
jgi:glyoxylase-like metal-dependent hydrolase (beta-lactamase superfamily II)